MKKLTAILLSALLACSMLAFTGCGDAADDGTYTVGIVQLVQHDALDQATNGFKAALVDKLGDKVTFDYQNASGDAMTCSTIADKFVTNKVDLIMANATPAVQAAKEATATIPIVGTSVTDYAASELVASNDAPGGNVTGASDMNAVSNQMELVKTLAPEAKNVGIIYCSAEDNSKLQYEEAKGVFETAGYTVTGYAVADVNELIAVVETAVKDNQVLYEPTDNLVAANMEVIKNAAVPAGVPVVCGEASMCLAGGVASYSINYFDVGYEAGLMAYEILVNGANPAEMPIKIFTADELTLVQNEEVMQEMGIAPIQ